MNHLIQQNNHLFIYAIYLFANCFVNVNFFFIVDFDLQKLEK